MTNGNNNAFATPLPSNGVYEDVQNYNGLSKREYFAAIALQGLLSHGWNIYEYDLAALNAVNAADYLIQQLNQKP